MVGSLWFGRCVAGELDWMIVAGVVWGSRSFAAPAGTIESD
ncbi:hypothetical protein Rhow_000900 [Rhodococcus wratislaviensis]|uniref:Uncharacterized protein n=1 Tax=Rhodococcus wratislaviensis TaxID=44752 RepID=A0A402C338_RHOWR|nr:hypothetical protein Rhow_000900 [Rhodococcus wratislaviensis]